MEPPTYPSGVSDHVRCQEAAHGGESDQPVQDRQCRQAEGRFRRFDDDLRLTYYTRLVRSLAVIVALLLPACFGCERSAPAPAAAPPPFFVDATEAWGVDVDLDRAAPGNYFMPDSMTGGVALEQPRRSCCRA